MTGTDQICSTVDRETDACDQTPEVLAFLERRALDQRLQRTAWRQTISGATVAQTFNSPACRQEDPQWTLGAAG